MGKRRHRRGQGTTYFDKTARVWSAVLRLALCEQVSGSVIGVRGAEIANTATISAPMNGTSDE
jgi:hypothetical protein